MKLYNTLFRSSEDFRPKEGGTVKLYTCGPTVYDYAHLGNLRSFVFDDTLRRSLESAGYKVEHVMNITDVGHLTSDMDEGEDKLEKGAAREHKTVWEVAESYIKAFEKDAAALNILPPNGYKGKNQPYARATDFITQQLAIVQTLLDKGYAYPAEQAIYFDVARLADYGKLTGQKLADKEVAARAEVVTDTDKRHPQDFALWFFTVGRFANHSMAWDSPWGKGFPGWHLECSAIIHATLGEPLDIHTGGVDHIGTHHTNEIAQTEAAFDTQLSRFWIHNEYLLVDNEKMSKSKGNFFTLKDVVEKGFEPLALRLLFLQSHYRSQMNFTWRSLEAAQKRLTRFRNVVEMRHQLAPQTEFAQSNSIERSIRDVQEAISDDMNTPGILAVIESELDQFEHDGILEGSKESFYRWLQLIDGVLGLGLEESTPDIDNEQKKIISEREKARESNNWSKADELRNGLASQGLEINDTPAGAIWRRV